MNVAITRAKQVLIVIGNAETLITNETWKEYIEFFIKNKYYIRLPSEKKMCTVVKEIMRNN